jgi:hypothetical protein
MNPALAFCSCGFDFFDKGYCNVAQVGLKFRILQSAGTTDEIWNDNCPFIFLVCKWLDTVFASFILNLHYLACLWCVT